MIGFHFRLQKAQGIDDGDDEWPRRFGEIAEDRRPAVALIVAAISSPTNKSPDILNQSTCR
jgi:hypothetical protein